MILYRGDNFSRINYYCPVSEGLLINSSYGGDPLTIEKEQICELIKKHVCPEIDNFDYHNVTDFISFTEEKNIAKGYISKKEIDETSYNNNPTFILFKIELNDLKQYSKGVYTTSYKISLNNTEKIFNSILDYNLRQIKLNRIRNKDFYIREYLDTQAKLKVINLHEFDEIAKFPIEIKKRFIRDKEWLILPFDRNRYDDRLGLETRLYPSEDMNYIFYKK